MSFYRKAIGGYKEYKGKAAIIIPRQRNNLHEKVKQMDSTCSSKDRLHDYFRDMFRMLHGFSNIRINYYIIVDLERTAGNNDFKIETKAIRSQELKHLLIRIINVWNSLTA